MAKGEYEKALIAFQTGMTAENNSLQQTLAFNEIVAYERNLDFLTAKDKCQTYVDNYPTDEKGQRELIFLNSRN